MDAEISTDDVHELVESDADVRIVDIRPEPQFDSGHIPGSENIPFHTLPSRIGELDGAEHVVTVCPLGKSSVQAARLIGSYEGVPEDTRVESMAGGLSEWEYELESSADAERDAPF
ncbi:Rhodanese domain protein [Haladaptatus paucihalophilus DX253]|uniref:Rhodanese domain protein n=1 Tax=Haladaptatus paucihalophilus DX253 TaxID=797209 RepID=E7QTW0_HALPU|nr:MULTISPECIES: rhodanese-like domain-containing protein [Haladaptatus]EFW92039.1 Rhodanese domain protein [Haladaptatus paucihalophilus DX253]GKZ14194.1 rhodanese-like domain-containing protein [Haladaptatus sp. T7]SHK86520.1 Rhodanese-related sulfurtransferase [Haladaptatus paucihalophilus DX253]